MVEEDRSVLSFWMSIGLGYIKQNASCFGWGIGWTQDRCSGLHPFHSCPDTEQEWGRFLALQFSALTTYLLFLPYITFWSFCPSCVRRACERGGVMQVSRASEELFQHSSCPLRKGTGFPYCSVTHGTPWKAEKLLRAKADDRKKASMYVLDYTVVYIRLHN